MGRNTNNNPTIFTNDRKPIVEFSIENRKALLARQKRLEKSKEKNPNMKSNKGDGNKFETINKQKNVVVDKSQFSGLTSDPKQKGLPTHSGPKVRTAKNKISRKDLRKQEQEKKNPKKRKQRETKLKVMPAEANTKTPKQLKKESRKQKRISKEAQKEKDSEKKFSSLVNQYVSNIRSNE